MCSSIIYVYRKLVRVIQFYYIILFCLNSCVSVYARWMLPENRRIPWLVKCSVCMYMYKYKRLCFGGEG